MNDSPLSSSTLTDWDIYWKGSKDSEALAFEGVRHPVLEQVLFDTLNQYKSHADDNLVFADVACGKGILAGVAKRLLSSKITTMVCIDSSLAALKNIKEKLDQTKVCVADAASLPLASNSIDLGMSQFGIEYAGLGSVGELCRTIKSKGELILLLHHNQGSIFDECDNNRRAVSHLIDVDFFLSAKTMLNKGYIALGGGDSENFKSAIRKFIPKYKALESIMDEFGNDVAGGMISTLYHEIARIQNRLQFYNPDEVISWIERLGDELNAYSGRMESMCKAALNEDEFREICDTCINSGFKINRSEELKPNKTPKPLAWLLTAKKA